jgi:hypothetical protein
MKNFTKKAPASKTIFGIGAGIQYSMCLFAAVLILNTTSVAQQKNKSTSKQSIQSSANSGDSSPNYRVTKQNGKLILSDGKSETAISNDPNASSPLVNGEEIYYIGKAEGNSDLSGSSIFVYHIKTKKTEDIVRQNSTACSYDLKSVVENLFLDKKSGKLYFSTSLKNRHGHTEFLTWNYDINSNKLAVYKDGRIESIDMLGNQTIVFEGFDSKGKFTSRTLVGTDGNIIKELGREYAAKTIK